MLILYEKELSNKKLNISSVALGSFEALHAGHIEIIKKTVLCAKTNKVQSVVTIFNNPVLKERKTACETFDERIKILQSLDVDCVVVFEFNEKFRKISDEEFFYKIVIEKLNAKYIFAGFNYRFGYKAQGDTDKLNELCNKNEIFLEIVPAIKNGSVISSTYIYELIKLGDAKKISECLNRPYSISGKVVTGRQIGRKLGFPTVNIEYPNEKAIIKNGVYLGECIVDTKRYYSIINVGLQPTVTTEITPKIEAYLFNFNEDIYGKKIKIEFIEKLRETIAFDNVSELKKQLDKDKIQAENIIKNMAKL